MHARLPVAVINVIIKDGKILLLLRRGTDKWDGMWWLPWGRLDIGESCIAWALRELEEETSLRAIQENISDTYVVHHRDAGWERIYFIIVLDRIDWTAINNEPDRCERIDWFALSALPSPLTPQVEIVLATLKQGKSYSQWGFDE